jgi:hypothetical protein
VKILVATKETQRQRESDFCWTEEGEIVRLAFECDRDKEDLDGKCGCRRSMTGCTSQRATTTMKVEDRNIKIEEYIEIIRESFIQAGWYKLMGEKVAEEHIMSDVKYMLSRVSKLPVGSIIEKRGDNLIVRRTP